MIDVEYRDATIVATICRSEQNTIDDQLADALDRVLAEAQRRDAALVHLRSSTPHFCGGADPARVRRWLDADGAGALAADGERWSRLFDRIETAPTIVLAEIRGNALGAGLGLALACDLRIASASARIGVPEVRVGLLPAGNTIRRLTELGGLHAAQRLLVAGDLIDGTEAHRLGLAHWVAGDDRLAQDAAALAARVAKQSPAALREGKRVLAAAARGTRSDAAAAESRAFAQLIADPEPRARITALLGRLATRG